MKRMKWLALTVVLALGMGLVATACSPKTPTPQPSSSPKVTYFDGTASIKTESVEVGEYATYWAPDDKTDKAFVNWYVDPGLNRLFDFKNEKITEDKNLYAGFAKIGTEDTRPWAILGSGQGDVLGSSNWGGVISEVHQLTKVANKNEFTITLDLYKGDNFQFATDGTWLNQRGVGYIPVYDMSGTINGSVVKVFSGGGGIGETKDKQKNTIVETPGNYTLTLKTFVDEDYYDGEVNNGKISINKFDSITWKYNGAAAELADSYIDFYVKGKDITGWGDVYNDSTRMTRIGKTYEMSLYLKTGDQVMFTSKNVNRETGAETVGSLYIKGTNLDAASVALFSSVAGGNMVPAADGVYTFKYNATTEILSVTFDAKGKMAEYDYYIDGKIGTANWGSYPKTEGKYAFGLDKQSDGTYLIENVELTEDDQFVLRGFAKGTAPVNGAQAVSYNYRNYVGKGGAFDAADETTKNYNIAVVTAGVYNVKYDPYSKILSIVPADMQHTVYIKGNSFADCWKITDAEGNLLDTYRLTEKSKGVFEITLTVTSDMVAGEKKWECMLMLDTTTGNDGIGMNVAFLDADAADNANNLFRVGAYNITTKTAGTYRFVFDLATNKINVFSA